jgi:rubrerythrin
MDLCTFGAVLTFAAELEAGDSRFYMSAIKNPVMEKYRSIFEKLAAVLTKNEKDLLRARRENVTEMILEPIHDFRAEVFSSDCSGATEDVAEAVLEKAVAIEAKAIAFYLLAAEKMRALPEVSRLLTKVGKSRAGNQMRLENLAR